jgi:hypothetical protein
MLNLLVAQGPMVVFDYAALLRDDVTLRPHPLARTFSEPTCTISSDNAPVRISLLAAKAQNSPFPPHLARSANCRCDEEGSFVVMWPQ